MNQRETESLIWSRRLSKRFPESIVAARQLDLVAICPEPDPVSTERDGPREVGRAAIQFLDQLFPMVKLTGGIGSRCGDATQLAVSFGHARRALGAAERFGRIGEVTAIEDLGVFRLLYQVNDPEELVSFAEATLGPILAFDREHNADLVRTLDVYLHHDRSVVNAARELFLHANTVRYRIQRIAAIGHLDLDDDDTRLSVQLAIKILQGLNLVN